MLAWFPRKLEFWIVDRRAAYEHHARAEIGVVAGEGFVAPVRAPMEACWRRR